MGVVQYPPLPLIPPSLWQLQAYETQAEYAARLKSRAEHMQEHVEDAADRGA